MRKTILAAVLSSSVALGGCATTGGVTTIDPAVQAQIAQVQAIAVQVCGFQPTAATVTGVIGQLFPQTQAAITIANQVANAICGAVTAKSYRRGSTPKFRGVAIRGKFVR